jgi:COP9 signalosome complex subunit 7
MEALDITETRELEDLCINTIYSSLLTGKLSPQTQVFEISSVTSRDLPPSHDYVGMIATLSQWSNQCDLVLAEISGRIRDVRKTEKLRKDEELAFEKEVERMRKREEGETATGKGKGKEKSFRGMGDEGGGGGGGGGGRMKKEDVGEDLWESPVRRKRKSPGGS